MENIAGEILQLVKKKMKEQGAYDRDSYDAFIEESIDYFKERGKMGDEENEGLILAELDEMFEHVKESMADQEIDIVYNEY
jgi:hypothetical protein